MLWRSCVENPAQAGQHSGTSDTGANIAAMGLLERYVLKRALVLFAGLTGLALAILLLERLLRIVELVSGASGTMTSAARLIVNLVPHYLEMALPAALFLSILITTERLSRSGELVAMLSSGVSLFRYARPFTLAALGLAALALLITGFAQPLARYDYRQIAHDIRQRSVDTAFQEGKFVQAGDYVVWTDHSGKSGNELASTFILEYREDGSRRFLSAPSGALIPGETGFAQIVMQDGMGADLPAGEGASSQLTYDRLHWSLPAGMEAFRARGGDERELTLPELFAAASGRLDAGVEPHIAATALHDQLARAVLILVLPFLAIALGLNFGRTPRAGSLAIGIVFMLVVQKALEFALILAERGSIAPWAGLWPVVGIIAFLSGYLFWRGATQVAAPLLSPLAVLRPVERRIPGLLPWRRRRT